MEMKCFIHYSLSDMIANCNGKTLALIANIY